MKITEIKTLLRIYDCRSTKKELMTDLINLRNIAATSMGLITIIALIVIGGYSLKIIKSLMELQKKIKQAELGDLTVRVHEGKQDEIGKLNRSFNNMVSEMQRLIVVVHKSELREKEMTIKQGKRCFKRCSFKSTRIFYITHLKL
ncbi:sensor histidine kinase [Bacillus sp. N9]